MLQFVTGRFEAVPDQRASGSGRIWKAREGLAPGRKQTIGPPMGPCGEGTSPLAQLVLAAQPGQVVDKETIVDTAWGGLAVADSSIAQAIHGLRETLGAQPDGEPYIATWVRMGYRLVVPVDATLTADLPEDRPVLRNS